MNSQELNQAAETLLREAKRQEQLVQAAKAIGDVGTLFARVTEAERVLVDVRKSTNDANAELAAAKSGAQAAKAQAAESIKNANEQAEQIVSGARDHAENTAREAQAAADKVLADATAAAEATKAEWEASFDRARATLDRLNAEIEQAQANIVAHADELKAIEEKLAKAKDAMRAALA